MDSKDSKDSKDSMDSKERFTETAVAYSAHRPGYPPELVAWIEKISAIAPGDTVLDLGCGTGITARLFADRFRVIGIDPNRAMLDQAMAWPKTTRVAIDIDYRLGEAERTGLSDASVDLVISGQAFHWFPIEATLAELRRVLRAGGSVVAFWNVRAQTALLKDLEALYSTLREYREVPKPLSTIDRIAAQPGLVDMERAVFSNVQHLDEPSFLGRVFSSSYVVHGVSDVAAFRGQLQALFRRHAANGTVDMNYDLHAVRWRFA